MNSNTYLELSIFIVDSVHKKICQIVQINLSCKHLSGGAVSLLEVQRIFGVSRSDSKNNSAVREDANGDRVVSQRSFDRWFAA